MFHPRGPYLRRSKQTAWKKFSPKNSFFHSIGFLHYSKLLASIDEKFLNILFFKPLGGSYVIFMPLINKVTGNTLEGIEVSQILKSLLTSYGGFAQISYSCILSNSGIKEGARWQF